MISNSNTPSGLPATTEVGIEQLLIDLDRTRCKAISEGDIATLETIVADDLSHVHQSGKHVNKEEFLDGIKKIPRLVSREDLSVHMYGTFALMTGVQTNTMPDKPPIHLFVTQVWIKTPTGWQQISFHCCGLGRN
jgi:hypothetical protein